MRESWVVLLVGIGCGGDKDPHDPRDDADADSDADTDADSDADADADSDADTDTDLVPAPCPEGDFVGMPRVAFGDTSGMTDDWGGSCGGAGAADYTVRFQAGGAGRYVFGDAGTPFDAVLTVTDGCGGAELGCDAASGPESEEVVVDLQNGQIVIVTVDGADVDQQGAFSLSVTRAPPVETDCDDGLDEDYDGDLDCDDSDCSCRDSGPDTGQPYFEASAVQPSAQFGYDAALGVLVAVNGPYGTIEPSLDLSVGDAEWEVYALDPALTDLYCVISLPLTVSTPAPWAAGNPALWYGLEYTGDPPVSNCTAADGFEVDPALWGGDLATALSTYGTWGVAVGDLSPAGAVALGYYAYAGVPVGSFAGGVFLDGLLSYEVDVAYTLVEEMDAAYTPLGTYVPPGSVQAAPTVVTGFYTVSAAYYVILN